MDSFTIGNDTRELVPYIDKLVELLGAERIKESVLGWERAVKTSRDSVLAYHRQAFYWWPAFRDFFALQDLLRSDPRMLLDPSAIHIVRLGHDARNIIHLWADMPASVRKKYLGALVDRELVASHVFEIGVAWNFHIRGMAIAWCEDTGMPIGEFIVSAPSVDFDIECKEFRPDKGRRIYRLDFCRLVDMIAGPIHNLGLKGQISHILNDRLPRDENGLGQISLEILAVVESGKRQGSFNIQSGELTLQLSDHDGVVIDLERQNQEFISDKPQHAHAALFVPDRGAPPANPLSITLSSKAADKLEDTFLNTLKDAARQVSKSRPAILFAYVPEVTDMAALMISALATIATRLFADSNRDHVCAVVFSSTPQFFLNEGAIELKTDSLVFPNAKCRFNGADEALRKLMAKGIR